MTSHWFVEGGPVLWVIAALGALAFLVFIERALHLHRARIDYRDFLKGVYTILGRGNVDEALLICEDTPGPVACLVRTAIMHRQAPADVLKSALDNVGHAEISRMERRLTVLATATQIAPLLGLLGTILGLMESLLIMRDQAPFLQSVDVTGGLLRALITTAGGLMTAIPCYAMFNLLVIKIDRIVLDMEQASTDVVAFLRAQDDSPKDGV